MKFANQSPSFLLSRIVPTISRFHVKISPLTSQTSHFHYLQEKKKKGRGWKEGWLHPRQTRAHSLLRTTFRLNDARRCLRRLRWGGKEWNRKSRDQTLPESMPLSLSLSLSVSLACTNPSREGWSNVEERGWLRGATATGWNMRIRSSLGQFIPRRSTTMAQRHPRRHSWWSTEACGLVRLRGLCVFEKEVRARDRG